MRLTVLAALFALAASAQDAGSISGRIVDPTGAVVPNIKLALRSDETGITRDTVSTGDGLYTFPSVAVGAYTVTAEAAGFKKAIAHNVKVEVAQRVQLDLTLEVGTVAEAVEVTAAPPQLQTSDSQIGGVVESKAISDPPSTAATSPSSWS